MTTNELHVRTDGLCVRKDKKSGEVVVTAKSGFTLRLIHSPVIEGAIHLSLERGQKANVRSSALFRKNSKAEKDGVVIQDNGLISFFERKEDV